MADRYAVATGNWNDTATWSATSGGAPGASFPVAGDNVFMNAASGAITVTVNVSSACADFDCTAFAGTFAGTSTLAISGNFKTVAGMTYSHTGVITLGSTAAGKTVTTGGKILPVLIFNGVGGGWTLQDALTISANNNVITRNGTLDTNGQTVTVADISQDSGTFTLTLGASTINLSGSSCIGFTSGTMTLNAGTSTINCSGGGAAFNGAGKTYNNVNFTATTGGTRTINGANTFATLTITNGATTIIDIVLGANQVVSGTFTCNGNSASNRPLLRSNTVGTARTITAATFSPTDLDFQDITGAGAASPFAGTRLGDCKGNSGITFAAAANRYRVDDATASWDAANSWATSSGGAGATNNYPLPHDTCIFDANSFSAAGRTVTFSSPHRVGSILCSGTDQSFGIASSQGPTVFGDVTLDANVTITGNAVWTYSGRNTQTITSAGKSWTHGLTIDSLGGTVTLADAFTCDSGDTLTLTRGTLDLNAKTFSGGRFSSSNSNVRALTFGTGGKIITADTTAATVFDCTTTTNLTVNRTGGAIEIGGNTTNVRTSNLGAGVSWPALSFTNTTAAGGLDLASSGAATVVKSLAVSTPPQTVRRTAGTTITIEDDNGFPSGTLGNLVTIGSITAASHTWTKSGASGHGDILEDYLSISRSIATPPSTWLAGLNSTDGGNNSGWIFSNTVSSILFLPRFL